MNNRIAIIQNSSPGAAYKSISDELLLLHNYEIPVIDYKYKLLTNSFKFILYELNYDYTSDIFMDYLDRQFIPIDVEQRIQNGTAGVLISLQKEAYFYILQDIHKWADKRLFPTQSIFYVTGAVNATAVYDAMFSKGYFGGRGKINILRYPQCEVYTTEINFPHPSTEDLKKKFLCLNRVSKPHRAAMVSFLCKTGISNESYYSYIMKLTPDLIAETRQCTNGSITEDDFARVGSPVYLDYVDESVSVNDTNPVIGSSIEPFFRYSLFSIVNETIQMDYNSQFEGIPYVFPTDKVYKTFYFYHLSIINGGAGIIAYLRDSGFDVFDDIIDHSYDSIVSGKDRLTAVFAEILRINAKYTIEACTSLRDELMPRLIKNRDMLIQRKGKCVNFIIDEFESVLSKLNVTLE
jgi:hypothetical protein